MTTVLLNAHNAGFYGFDSMILDIGLVYGGLAQVIASIMEYRKGNTFGIIKTNRSLQFVLLNLAVLFFLLTVRDLTGNVAIAPLTGYEGVVCGLSAV